MAVPATPPPRIHPKGGSEASVNLKPYLSLRWNNLLSLVLGLPALVFVAVMLARGAYTDHDPFIGMVVLGALY